MDKSALSERSKSYIRQAQYDPERQSNGSKGFTPYRLVQGFTLIELLVTIAIIAILTVIGIVLFTGVQKGARDSRRKADIDAIAKAYEVSYSDGLYYPLTGTNFAQGAIPQKPEGGDYDGMLSANAPGFQVCAALEANPSRNCFVPAPDCFCKQSTQGKYIAVVGNSGFEADLAGWQDYNSVTRTQTSSEAYSGSYSMQVITGGLTAYQGTLYNPSNPGAYSRWVYTFSAYVKRNEMEPLQIAICDESGGVWQCQGNPIPAIAGWQYVSVTKTLQSSITNLQLIINTITNGQPSITFYVDNAYAGGSPL